VSDSVRCNQHHSESCFALHHASVSISRLFQRGCLDHRSIFSSTLAISPDVAVENQNRVVDAAAGIAMETTERDMNAQTSDRAEQRAALCKECLPKS
jgi:hypothetical protein